MNVASGVEVLWHNDWYDGPLDGVALYQGVAYFFRVATDDWVGQRPRQYVLVELTEAEMASEREAHEDFERLVGTRYCEHVPAAERVERDPALWNEFWALHPSNEDPPAYADRPGVAVFTLDG